MNRRRFLGGGLLGLASSGVQAFTSPESVSQEKPFLSRWVKVRGWIEDSHPKRRLFCGEGPLAIWIDFDRLTGKYDIGHEYDHIYRWPLANLLLFRDDPIPEDWRNRGSRYLLPVPPSSMEWSQWMDDVEVVESSGFQYRFPRYVKISMNRDIVRYVGNPPPFDRREECIQDWMDVDLMTGHMVQCAVDDPIFDSELANNNVFE
ncbi:hypothetical protein [Chromatocurvus halotolerans]|uniref:Secreted protein n=1 Tax=Chromatocurvus halotolerans TaxID=1132028 RepID=A0A4R2KHF5_9GAMM|nr:hypothetical protein [Chromatocurvus halotolerans]TCO71787.1 hypothetical protein EV688_12141 [Chromatocurvus halotolerans]